MYTSLKSLTECRNESVMCFICFFLQKVDLQDCCNIFQDCSEKKVKNKIIFLAEMYYTQIICSGAQVEQGGTHKERCAVSWSGPG